MIHLLLAIITAAGLCYREDFFNDSVIGSMWTQQADPESLVEMAEQPGGLDAGLWFTFGQCDPREEPAVAGIYSNGWVLDMNQSGTLQVQFIDGDWPEGVGDSLGLGALIFDGFDAEGDPDTIIEVLGGVHDGAGYIRLQDQNGEGEDISEADLKHFDGTLYIWWTPDVGIWLGFSPMYVVDGAPWDAVFDPGGSMSLSFALFGANNGCTATLTNELGFSYFCYAQSTDGMPGLCAADVVPTYEIDAADLTAVLDAWGQTCTGCREDVDGDGHITMLDLITVIAAWGDCLIPPA